MAKLIDEILFGGERMIVPRGKIWQELKKANPEETTREQARELIDRHDAEVKATRQSINDSVVIVADNVCEYVFAHTGKLRWDVEKDFPCLTPPFPNCWIEMHAPSKLVKEMPDGRRGEITSGWGISRWAFHCVSATLDQLDKIIIYDDSKDPLMRSWATVWSEIAHVMRLDYYWRCTDSTGGPLDTLYLAVDQLGRCVAPLFTTKSNTTLSPTTFGLDEGDGQDHFAQWHLSPVLLAISFMHCKNVELIDEEPPAKLQKARRRRGQKPLIRYKTLNIAPMTKILKHEGDAEKSGLKHALHICRGHFKRFEGKGLFGKHKGLYFWNQHIRGSKDEGIVVKDYSVDVPKTA